MRRHATWVSVVVRVLGPETCPQLGRYDPHESRGYAAEFSSRKPEISCKSRSSNPQVPRFESWRGAKKHQQIPIFLTGVGRRLVRSVPVAPEVAEALARLRQRERFVGPDDLVFVGLVGGHLDASALLRRYRAALRGAGLRPLRFHDLRHTFGTRVIGKPTSGACRSGWDTPTSRPRCAICTTRRGTTTLRSSVARSQPTASQPARQERRTDGCPEGRRLGGVLRPADGSLRCSPLLAWKAEAAARSAGDVAATRQAKRRTSQRLAGRGRVAGRAARPGSRRTRPFRARGSAGHPGSAGWHAPPPRQPVSRTPVRSLRRGSSGPPPPSPDP
jgi:hypothetical protein